MNMRCLDFISALHTGTKRDYIERVTSHDKGECATIAKQWGADYWDGPRQYGYGGMRYDGRWLPVAKEMAKFYGVESGGKVLDVGAGKGYLLYEFTRAVPGVEVAGLDISEYGIENSKEEIKPFLTLGNATKLPYEDNSFDFVVSITTLHNLRIFDLRAAVQEIERVGKDQKYILVESYRNESEKANLLYWQLTCRSFYTPQEWEWVFEQCGYTGDYSYIVFE